MSKSLAKKLAEIKPGTLFVGVDLALERNVAVVLDTKREPPRGEAALSDCCVLT